MFSGLRQRWTAYREGIPRSDYLAGITKLVSAAALAHVVTFASAPVITRLYGPHAYGIAAGFSALYLVFAAVAAFRYDYAVILPERERDARSAFSLCFWLILLSSGLLALGMGIAWTASPWIRAQPVAPLLYLVPVVTALNAMVLLAHAWANRQREYGVLARMRVINAFVPPLVAIGAFVLLGAEPIGLVIGWTTAQVTAILLIGLFLNRAGAPLPWPLSASLTAMRRLAVRYQQFPKYNVWKTLLEQGTTLLPVLVFASIFSPAVAAWFALANNMLRVPTEMIAHAVSHVFYERAARLRDQPAELRRLVARTLLGLSGASAALLIGAVILAPVVFPFVFGQDWAPAGHYTQLLAPLAAMAILTIPLGLIPAVLGRQGKQLALSIGVHGARIAGIVAGSLMGSPVAAILLYSAGDVLVSSFYLWWLWRQVDAPAAVSGGTGGAQPSTGSSASVASAGTPGC
jgi:lipopolysaccharide exporter